MIDAILKGILVGLTLSIYVGVTFFLLVDTSINKGGKIAVSFELGVLLADLIFILTGLLASELLSNLLKNKVFQLFGVGVYILFGSYCLLSKGRNNTYSPVIHGVSFLKSFFKGFFVNIANPSVLLTWFTIITVVVASYKFKTNQLVGFFGAILLVLFITDLIKIISAKKIKKYIKPGLFQKINIVIGLLLISVGLFFLFRLTMN
ncbi:MAG: LysE family translocator [Bacteroidota bacterium]